KQSMPATAQNGSGQKLRNSCDACNLAKVKCSKGRPACNRCESQGTQCIYGVSMRAGKHRATGSNIQKPRLESPSSARSSTKESTPTPTFTSDERTQTFDPSLTSIMDAMPMNGDWSSILTDDCNPYLMNNAMDLDDNSMKQKHYSKPFSDSEYTYSPSDLSMDPAILMNQDCFVGRSQTYSGSPDQRPLTGSTLTSDSQQSPLASVPSVPCHCNQKVLQQLLTLTKIPDVPAAFDTALNQNKQVINLCHNILNDTSHHHHDISFVLTLTALIAKVIAVYDAIYNPYHRQNGTYSSINSQFPTFRDADMTSEPMEMPSSISAPQTLTHNSPFSSSASLSGRNSPRSTNFPVRLTLGTYRLDEKDEERLKFDIFKIELSKVSALVRAFEQRFCDTGPHDQQQSKYEAKAYEDMVYYLQKRLRVSLETPRDVATGYA
ncbi:MAG: hypothetical protein Q9217_002767, partial [Psora testacea]